MQAVVKPHIFDESTAIKFEISEGNSVQNFIDRAELPLAVRPHIRAEVNGVPVTNFDAPLSASDLVSIYIVPMGGGDSKGILRIVAMIAVVATAGILAPVAGGAMGGFFATSAGISILTAGFSALGMLAINALIPPPSLDTGGYNSASPATTYTITGQSNAMSPYGVIPRLYGIHKFYPRLCAQPLIWNTDKDSYMTAVYDYGYAELEINDTKIGATSIDNFDTQTNFIEATKGDDLIYYTQKVDIQNVGVELKAGNEVVRETATSAKTAEAEIYLPAGLARLDDKGNPLKTTVDLEVSYRIAGSSNPFSKAYIKYIGAGVKHEDYHKTIQLQLRPFLLDNFRSVYKLIGTQLRANLTQTLYAGDYISNVNVSGGLVTREVRRVVYTVTAGNNKTVIIDKPFTNFTRTTIGAGLNLPRYFDTKYTTPNANLTIENNTREAYTVTAKFTFPTVDQYEIKIKRITDDIDPDDSKNRTTNQTNWTLLRSFEDDKVLDLDTNHTLIELSLKANEQINGVVDNLNSLCKSKLNIWTGSNFINDTTDNPAWIVLDILTGSANAGGIQIDQVDLDSFKAFADYCDQLIDVEPEGELPFKQKRHRSSFVVNSRTTVNDLIQSVLSQARASLKINSNGKYGILYDVEKTLPVQMFTTRNSSGFSSERTYTDIPHALRVKYVNPLIDYEIDEVIVYADGYDALTAEIFDTVETFGITDYYEAWRHGRYTLAQMIAYQETFTIDVDLEHLSVQRGELVSVQNDVPQIGGNPARVKEVLDSGKTIILNDAMEYDGVSEYHYLVRANDLTIETGVIENVTDENIITLVTANTNIKAGDIFVYGFKDYVTKDYLVTAIMPNADLKAKLTLIPYNPDVYTADTGIMPTYDSSIAPELGGDCRVKIENLTVTYSLTYDNRLPIPTFSLNWEVDSNVMLKNYMIEWASNGINGLDFTVAGYTTDTNYEVKLDNLAENRSLIDNEIIIRVTPIGTNDKKCIPSSPVSAIIVPDTTPPPDIEFFNCNIVNETLNLTWKQPEAPDLDYFIIKYNESTDQSIATWEKSVLLTDAISHTTLRHTTNARTGTYLIKAVDTSGNYSINATRAVTSIPNIININHIETVEDAPEWTGNKVNLITEAGELRTTPLTEVPTCPFTICDGYWKDNKVWSDSQNWIDTPFDYSGTLFATSGLYTFNDVFDLGDIYTARLSTAIKAYASQTDEFIYSWETLSDIEAMGKIGNDRWNAYITVRMASDTSTISDWEALSEVTTLDDASGADWTEEALTEAGDFTGRYFKFYLHVETESPAIRIHVQSAEVSIDMPDRIISENDILTDGNTRIVFNPAFFVTPALGITQDNAQKGDRYVITNKDESGFNIEFFDTDDLSVNRQFDYIARAYGAKTVNLI